MCIMRSNNIEHSERRTTKELEKPSLSELDLSTLSNEWSEWLEYYKDPEIDASDREFFLRALNERKRDEAQYEHMTDAERLMYAFSLIKEFRPISSDEGADSTRLRLHYWPADRYWQKEEGIGLQVSLHNRAHGLAEPKPKSDTGALFTIQLGSGEDAKEFYTRLQHLAGFSHAEVFIPAKEIPEDVSQIRFFLDRSGLPSRQSGRLETLGESILTEWRILSPPIINYLNRLFG